MTCAQGLLRLLWGGGPEVGVLRDWVEERKWQIASHLDNAAPQQESVSPGREVHLPNYLLAVQMSQDKAEVHTSEQEHMREVIALK